MDHSLEASLAVMIARDDNDFSSRNKLRLLKILRAVAGEESDWTIVVGVLASGPIDTLQYQMFGHDKKACTLADLIHPRNSLLGECQAKLLDLATTFDSEPSSVWRLLRLVRVDVHDEHVRREARRQLLQSCAGLLDIFELRYSGMPYQLAWTCFDDLPLELQEKAVANFFQTPKDCLSFLSFQLRNKYPHRHIMLAKAPLVLGTWLKKRVRPHTSVRKGSQRDEQSS